MYKAVPLGEIYITTPLLLGNSLVRVPVATHDHIAAALGATDWTYLLVRHIDRTEVVKVIGTQSPDALIVLRKQDNTEEQSFPIGASVSFVDTAAGVLDSFSPVPLQLTPQLAIETAGDVVGYKDVSIAVSEGGEIVGDDPKLHIVRVEKAYGCCP